MRTMIKIEGYHNGILGVYNLADIDSLTHDTEKGIVSIRLVSGERIKFEDVFNVEEENLYDEEELEAINKNREMLMLNNGISQERDIAIQALSQNMVNTIYHSPNYTPYGYLPLPPIYNMQPNNNN